MTEINLTPPEPDPTLSDKLEALSIAPVWDTDKRTWTFPGLVTDYDEVACIGHLLQDEEADVLLTRRDKETIVRLVNNELDADYLELDESLTWDIFCYYGDSPHRGPSINIKLHDTYDFWRVVEKGLGYEFPDEAAIDPDYSIWNDTIEWEWEHYMDTVIPEDHPSLDPKRFMRLGRSGGHLVYDIRDRHLTVAEAWDFMQLEEVAPKYVHYVAAEIVHNQAAHALLDQWDEAYTEWLEAEEEAVAEAVRANDLRQAAWHQANIDTAKGKEFFDLDNAREVVWDTISDHLDEE